MCDVDVERCSGLMGRLADDIKKDDNCGLDYDDENPLVLQAYKGMQAYQPLARAGCLRSSSGSFCTYEYPASLVRPGGGGGAFFLEAFRRG